MWAGACFCVVRIGLLCLSSVRLGNLLPLLLFASAFLPLINGEFGQPTILGFVVFTTGLAFAARNQRKKPVGGTMTRMRTRTALGPDSGSAPFAVRAAIA